MKTNLLKPISKFTKFKNAKFLYKGIKIIIMWKIHIKDNIFIQLSSTIIC